MLTPKGRKKLDDAARVARQALQARLDVEALAIKRRAADLAPQESEEAELVSHGVSASGASIGTPNDGRFERSGAFISLADAIETDPVTVTVRGSTVTATSGQPARINARTGFFWATRRRGMQGPSFPFNNHFVEAMENGGIWVVVPRGPWSLEPEPFVVTPRMIKTLPPRRMYANAMTASRGPLRDGIEVALSAAVRTVGLA